MLWQSLLLVFGVLFVTGAAVKAARWARVKWAIRAIPPEQRRRHAVGVDMRIELQGVSTFAGLHPTKGNRTRGDLVLSDTDFMVATTRGVLVRLGPDRGRRFSSVRCTGPMRLVLEGTVARPDDQLGLYRFAIVTDDAEGWAEALQDFVAS